MTGHRFSELFTLVKADGQWKIMNKVFHSISKEPQPEMTVCAHRYVPRVIRPEKQVHIGANKRITETDVRDSAPIEYTALL